MVNLLHHLPENEKIVGKKLLFSTAENLIKDDSISNEFLNDDIFDKSNSFKFNEFSQQLPSSNKEKESDVLDSCSNENLLIEKPFDEDNVSNEVNYEIDDLSTHCISNSLSGEDGNSIDTSCNKESQVIQNPVFLKNKLLKSHEKTQSKDGDIEGSRNPLIESVIKSCYPIKKITNSIRIYDKSCILENENLLNLSQNFECPNTTDRNDKILERRYERDVRNLELDTLYTGQKDEIDNYSHFQPLPLNLEFKSSEKEVNSTKDKNYLNNDEQSCISNLDNDKCQDLTLNDRMIYHENVKRKRSDQYIENFTHKKKRIQQFSNQIPTEKQYDDFDHKNKCDKNSFESLQFSKDPNLSQGDPKSADHNLSNSSTDYNWKIFVLDAIDLDDPKKPSKQIDNDLEVQINSDKTLTQSENFQNQDQKINVVGRGSSNVAMQLESSDLDDQKNSKLENILHDIFDKDSPLSFSSKQSNEEFDDVTTGTIGEEIQTEPSPLSCRNCRKMLHDSSVLDDHLKMCINYLRCSFCNIKFTHKVCSMKIYVDYIIFV